MCFKDLCTCRVSSYPDYPVYPQYNLGMSFIPSAQLTLHGSLEAGKGRVHPDGVFAGGGLGSTVELGDCTTVEHQLCTCVCVGMHVRRGRERKKRKRDEMRKQKRNRYDSLFFACV